MLWSILAAYFNQSVVQLSDYTERPCNGMDLIRSIAKQSAKLCLNPLNSFIRSDSEVRTFNYTEMLNPLNSFIRSNSGVRTFNYTEMLNNCILND
jgi:hypothetical protein